MRGITTLLDRTLNEWSEWQLKNLNAIVWLYRGETDKYRALIQEYHDWLGEDSFDEINKLAEEIMTDLRKEAKEAVNAAAKKDKKQLQAKYDGKIADQENLLQVAKEAAWLYDKFGDGEYKDIPRRTYFRSPKKRHGSTTNSETENTRTSLVCAK